MKENKFTKISLSTFFLILAIITIIVMGILIYKLNNDKDVTYTVSVRDEVYATIKATKNGKTISKEFEIYYWTN